VAFPFGHDGTADSGNFFPVDLLTTINANDDQGDSQTSGGPYDSPALSVESGRYPIRHLPLGSWEKAAQDFRYETKMEEDKTVRTLISLRLWTGAHTPQRRSGRQRVRRDGEAFA
jgi:hypothetical protein